MCRFFQVTLNWNTKIYYKVDVIYNASLDIAAYTGLVLKFML